MTLKIRLAIIIAAMPFAAMAQSNETTWGAGLSYMRLQQTKAPGAEGAGV